jgi:hypothetical protein
MLWQDRQLSPMKIGAVPVLARVHAGDLRRVAPGKVIRVQETEGGEWQRVLVTYINEYGHIFANK